MAGAWTMWMNLEQQRLGPNVWERRASWKTWDLERWIASLAAGGLLTAGLRRRSAAGGVMVALGSALAWWALTGGGMRSRRRAQLRAVLPHRARQTDVVAEASEASFPASDAPSWTPTTGGIGTRVPRPGES